jgi:hypothetical protein
LSYTWTLGKQTLKFGAEFQRINTEVQDTNPLYGSDSYNSQFSRPATRASSNQYNLADFMLGFRTQYELATLMVAQMRQRSLYGYVQDDWKVTARLTLNMGVRYEFVTPYTDAQNRMSNFDPATRSIVQAKAGSLAERALVNPDRNNFAPRFGFAYKLTKGTVLRGGYGIGYIYFNRLGSANLLATNYPQVTRATMTQSTTDAAGKLLPLCSGNQWENCFRATQTGYPSGLPNDVVLYIPKDLRNGYVQNWQFSIQRKLARDTMVDIGYVGNHSLKLVLLADYNQARVPLPGENALATLDDRRPIKGYGSISGVLPLAFSNYHALQTKVEHRATRSLNLLNSFTWSKGIDNASQVLEEPNGSTGTPQNLYDLSADRGISGYNVPFLNTTSAVWTLPVGKGRRFGRNLPGVVEAVAGGWQLSAINTMRSGRTINMRYNTSGPTPVTAGLATFLGGVNLRPNLIGDPMTPEDVRSIENYLNRATVVLPPVTAPFGNAGRNVVRGYAYYQLNMGLQKTVRLPWRERMSVQVKGEAFNLLNKTNFGAPTGDRNSGSFGVIRSAYAARQMQLALKVSF